MAAPVAFVRVRSAPRIRRAWPHEAPALTALAVRAQATWGYGREEMAVFEGWLRLAPEALTAPRAFAPRTFVMEAADRLAGFYTLVPADEATLELRHLFVDPAFMGRGFGSRLLTHAREEARRAGHTRLVVRSDPHAERFYRMRGAMQLRLLPSRLAGQRLALLELLL